MNAKDFNVYRLYGIYGELLTENQRAVIEDYFGLDLSLGEIAEMKGISRQAVKDTLAKGEKLAIEHNKQHEYVEKRLNHYASQQVVLAKSIYDTYVDRGLIEKDEDFEKMWFDFYFNEKELNLKKAPQEFNKILVRVVAL